MALPPGPRRCMALLGPPGPQALHDHIHLHPALSCLIHSLPAVVTWALWMGTFLAGGTVVTRTAEGLLPEADVCWEKGQDK